MQPYENHNIQEEETIDIKEIIYKVLSHWHWFVISIAIFLALGYYYQRIQPRIYESTTTVLLRQEQKAPEEMMLFEDMGFNVGKNNIDNEIGVFKSPDLLTRIISSMELHTTYHREAKFGLYSPELYLNSPLYVRMENVEPDKIPGTTTLVFHPNRDSSFNVHATYIHKGEEHTTNTTIDTLPGFIELPIGQFYVARQAGIPFGTDPLRVTIRNAAQVARNASQNLNISATTKQSTMLEIKHQCENRNKGEDFINALVAEYNRDAIADKNTVAYNTSVFIDERLKDIAAELGEVEGQVEQFRREYEVTDIETQVGSYMRRSEGYETRRMEIETQLNLVQYIEDFILNPANRNKLIPNLGIKDPGLAALIGEYNELLLNRERIEAATSTENPALKQLNQQVANMFQNITTSIGNEKRASQIALQDLEREYTITSSRISNIPTVERQYTDIVRQQEVKSNLFLYLLQKREETNLTQAAVAPKAKMIAKPHTGTSPVEPKTMMLMAIFLMIGIALPSAALYLKDLFFTKIEGTKEFEKLKDANLIGDIIKSEVAIATKNAIVINANDTGTIGEMFRTLRNNLLFMTTERSNNIILVTSTLPKEGKTFISANLARSLSLMDKKTLLIGADLRNPQISATVKIPKRDSGLSSYLAGRVQNHNELIERVDPYFFVMQSGPIPPNPNELLSKELLHHLLEQLKGDFDYIILDSAPVGVVSDTFLIARYASATIYVVREGYSEKDTVPFINNLVADKRLKNVGVVLNYATAHDNLGRYKYGYKYKYRYKNGYSQGYGADNQ